MTPTYKVELIHINWRANKRRKGLICYVITFIYKEAHRPRFSLRTFQSLSYGAPVDDVPDGLEVLGLAVLVLQVVGVLPGVDTQQGDLVAGDGVLVGLGDDLQGAGLLVLDEPGPAAALDAGERGVDLGLQGAEGAEVLVDGGLELALGLAAAALAGRRQVLPEQAVVLVPAAVEVEERRDGGGADEVVLGLGLLEGLEGAVQAADVRRVVALVVQLHDLARDVGFERAVVILPSSASAN